jgi:integrase
MPAEQRGHVYTTRDGVGIRWREGGQRVYRSGFRTKTDARRWFADNVAPRLRRGAPSNEITYDTFCVLFLERHGPTVAASTKATLEERLGSSRKRFGSWTLRELEGAAADIAKWRADLPASSRYRLTSAFRQALGAAVRWDFITRNPAVEAGKNPQPRSEELRPFAPEQIDALAVELGAVYGLLVVVAVETGLRPEEWVALERRDIDKSGQALTVQRKYANGVLTPYPKTNRSRRRVPLTSRALAVLDALPPRVDTKLVFPAAEGGYIGLDTWRTREWYPALEAADIEQRGPYCLRHTFATEALAAGVSTFELSRVMGTSIAMIDRTYGHLARDSEASIRARLEARTNRLGVDWASDAD